MKSFLTSIILLLSVLSLNAQDLRTYEAGADEELEDVASKFQIDLTTLKRLNPNILNESDLSNSLLVVPTQPNYSLDPRVQLIAYDVSPKETLYSISKAYNLKVKDLKIYNPFLTERELNYNDVLRIPTYELKDKDLDINQSIKNSEFNSLMHLVLPKETKYGISRKYGLTVEQLEDLNPGIDEKEIQPGQFLNIERPADTSETKRLKNKNYAFLEVNSENSIQSISENYDVTEEELIESNPSLKFEGMSVGLVLKIPQAEKINYSKYKQFIFEDKLRYFDTKKIALMLPLNLERTEIDSISPTSLLKASNLLRISLDFYEGIQMAIDSARNKGIRVNLDVFDTRNNPSYVREQLNEDFKNYQAVVGPLLDPSLKVVASYLSTDSVPVISPLVNPNFEFNNLFNTLPKDEEMQEVLITYLQKTHTDENLVILSDSISKPIQRKYSYTFPDLKVVNQAKSDYLQRSDLRPQLDSLGTNWFILETQNLGLAESAVGLLNSFRRDGFDIRLFTSKRNAFYDNEISNYYLSNLNFTFPSISKTQLLSGEDKYTETFKQKYGVYPSRYVMRGFDVMMDLILRLAYAKTLQASTEIEGFTEHAENKFNYVKKEFSLGYENDAIYLLQYQKGLKVKALDLADFLVLDVE
ncbi:amino acid ABC transporter substrate-binding protein [Psychroflexus sediminis]|uniref:Amino acid/amide ABC transporter substrate-binding protein, HAAT family n=1 Tax=Psychroflexus sediminis TaxID=470826 RepID=A0A1G7WBV0_9FLAO|nr:LysM peptidoglycan-binding domain-containing protein [Psychroflexus sediminis]SDG69476.1 amino acid/amide ABC transporter substrate-binding protein, HAAT family [Psychroflexus sediminis]